MCSCASLYAPGFSLLLSETPRRHITGLYDACISNLTTKGRLRSLSHSSCIIQKDLSWEAFSSDAREPHPPFEELGFDNNFHYAKTVFWNLSPEERKPTYTHAISGVAEYICYGTEMWKIQTNTRLKWPTLPPLRGKNGQQSTVFPSSLFLNVLYIGICDPVPLLHEDM